MRLVATDSQHFQGGGLTQQFITGKNFPSLLFFLLTPNFFQEPSCFHLSLEWTPLFFSTVNISVFHFSCYLKMEYVRSFICNVCKCRLCK